MKLEFLADGSPDCPLIRLHSFDYSSVCRLRDLVKSLAVGTRASAPLHAQPWIEPVDGCKLELYLDERSQGIVEVGPSKFKLVLNDERWADIAGLIEPFCESVHPETYQ